MEVIAATCRKEETFCSSTEVQGRLMDSLSPMPVPSPITGALGSGLKSGLLGTRMCWDPGLSVETELESY